MRKAMESTISIEADIVTPPLLLDRRNQILEDDLPLAMQCLLRTCSVEAGNQTSGSPLGYPIDYAEVVWEAANLLSECIGGIVSMNELYFCRVAEPKTETEVAALPPHLARIKRGMAELRRKARLHRNVHGSPAENLSRLLSAEMTVEEWQDLLDEPYG